MFWAKPLALVLVFCSGARADEPASRPARAPRLERAALEAKRLFLDPIVKERDSRSFIEPDRSLPRHDPESDKPQAKLLKSHLWVARRLQEACALGCPAQYRTIVELACAPSGLACTVGERGKAESLYLLEGASPPQPHERGNLSQSVAALLSDSALPKDMELLIGKARSWAKRLNEPKSVDEESRPVFASALSFAGPGAHRLPGQLLLELAKGRPGKQRILGDVLAMFGARIELSQSGPRIVGPGGKPVSRAGVDKILSLLADYEAAYLFVAAACARRPAPESCARVTVDPDTKIISEGGLPVAAPRVQALLLALKDPGLGEPGTTREAEPRKIGPAPSSQAVFDEVWKLRESLGDFNHDEYSKLADALAGLRLFSSEVLTRAEGRQFTLTGFNDRNRYGNGSFHDREDWAELNKKNFDKAVESLLKSRIAPAQKRWLEQRLVVEAEGWLKEDSQDRESRRTGAYIDFLRSRAQSAAAGKDETLAGLAKAYLDYHGVTLADDGAQNRQAESTAALAAREATIAALIDGFAAALERSIGDWAAESMASRLKGSELSGIPPELKFAFKDQPAEFVAEIEQGLLEAEEHIAAGYEAAAWARLDELFDRAARAAGSPEAAGYLRLLQKQLKKLHAADSFAAAFVPGFVPPGTERGAAAMARVKAAFPLIKEWLAGGEYLPEPDDRNSSKTASNSKTQELLKLLEMLEGLANPLDELRIGTAVDPWTKKEREGVWVDSYRDGRKEGSRFFSVDGELEMVSSRTARGDWNVFYERYADGKLLDQKRVRRYNSYERDNNQEGRPYVERSEDGYIDTGWLVVYSPEETAVYLSSRAIAENLALLEAGNRGAVNRVFEDELSEALKAACAKNNCNLGNGGVMAERVLLLMRGLSSYDEMHKGCFLGQGGCEVTFRIARDGVITVELNRPPKVLLTATWNQNERRLELVEKWDGDNFYRYFNIRPFGGGQGQIEARELKMDGKLTKGRLVRELTWYNDGRVIPGKDNRAKNIKLDDRSWVEVTVDATKAVLLDALNTAGKWAMKVPSTVFQAGVATIEGHLCKTYVGSTGAEEMEGLLMCANAVYNAMAAKDGFLDGFVTMTPERQQKAMREAYDNAITILTGLKKDWPEKWQGYLSGLTREARSQYCKAAYKDFEQEYLSCMRAIPGSRPRGKGGFTDDDLAATAAGFHGFDSNVQRLTMLGLQGDTRALATSAFMIVGRMTVEMMMFQGMTHAAKLATVAKITKTNPQQVLKWMQMAQRGEKLGAQAQKAVRYMRWAGRLEMGTFMGPAAYEGVDAMREYIRAKERGDSEAGDAAAVRLWHSGMGLLGIGLGGSAGKVKELIARRRAELVRKAGFELRRDARGGNEGARKLQLELEALHREPRGLDAAEKALELSKRIRKEHPQYKPLADHLEMIAKELRAEAAQAKKDESARAKNEKTAGDPYDERARELLKDPDNPELKRLIELHKKLSAVEPGDALGPGPKFELLDLLLIKKMARLRPDLFPRRTAKPKAEKPVEPQLSQEKERGGSERTRGEKKSGAKAGEGRPIEELRAEAASKAELILKENDSKAIARLKTMDAELAALKPGDALGPKYTLADILLLEAIKRRRPDLFAGEKRLGGTMDAEPEPGSPFRAPKEGVRRALGNSPLAESREIKKWMESTELRIELDGAGNVKSFNFPPDASHPALTRLLDGLVAEKGWTVSEAKLGPGARYRSPDGVCEFRLMGDPPRIRIRRGSEYLMPNGERFPGKAELERSLKRKLTPDEYDSARQFMTHLSLKMAEPSANTPIAGLGNEAEFVRWLGESVARKRALLSNSAPTAFERHWQGELKRFGYGPEQLPLSEFRRLFEEGLAKDEALLAKSEWELHLRHALAVGWARKLIKAMQEGNLKDGISIEELRFLRENKLLDDVVNSPEFGKAHEGALGPSECVPSTVFNALRAFFHAAGLGEAYPRFREAMLKITGAEPGTGYTQTELVAFLRSLGVEVNARAIGSEAELLALGKDGPVLLNLDVGETRHLAAWDGAAKSGGEWKQVVRDPSVQGTRKVLYDWAELSKHQPIALELRIADWRLLLERLRELGMAENLDVFKQRYEKAKADGNGGGPSLGAGLFETIRSMFAPKRTALETVEPKRERISAERLARTKAEIKELVDAPLVSAVEILYDKNIQVIEASANRESRGHALLVLDAGAINLDRIAALNGFYKDQRVEFAKRNGRDGKPLLEIRLPLDAVDLSGLARRIAQDLTAQTHMAWAPVYQAGPRGPPGSAKDHYWDPALRRYFLSKEHADKFSGPWRKEFLAKRAANARLFEEKARIEARKFKKLPERSFAKMEGIDARAYETAFNTILELMADKKRFFELMQELELDVRIHEHKTGRPRAEAFREVLAEWEQKHGFQSEITVIASEGNKTKDWKQVLRDCRMFYDRPFEYKAHGAETHRVQWNIVMRDLEVRPAAYGKLPNAGELFKFLGKADLVVRWNETPVAKGLKERYLWVQLFDSFERVDFSSPEYFNALHLQNYWPYLGGWK